MLTFGGFGEMGSVSVGDLKVFQGFSENHVSSLVLDGERAELVGAPGRNGGGGAVSDAKAAMALKNHSDAERRRRERINNHLGTLRSLVPCTDKLDKAALLAEVINHVKELKSNAVEISKGFTVPSDVDEVKVEVQGDGLTSGIFSINASLCCEDRPEVLADLRQTIQSLHLKIIRAEISTLGGRMKTIFSLSCEGNTTVTDRHLLTVSIHQALKSVLDRATSAPEILLRTAFSTKRRRMSLFKSSSSSS